MNLALATDGQLASYGLPPRPQDPTRLAAWTQQMSHRHSLTPPPALIETHVRNDKCITHQTCWAGYVAKNYNSNTAFNWAQAIYNEPQALSTSCSPNAESTWAGLGGYGTSALAQDGTSINAAGLGQHQSWYEILPANAVAEPVYGHPGYAFTAEVNHPGNGTFNFNLYDSYSNFGIQFVVGSSSYDGSSAEAITEAPLVNNVQQYRTNYAYINFLDVWVNGSGSGANIGQYNPINVSSTAANGTPLSNNNAIFNGGQSFKNNFLHCG